MSVSLDSVRRVVFPIKIDMPLALAGSCKRKYAETQSAFPSATATRANEGLAAYLARRRALRPNPYLSKVLARSLFGLDMQAQDTSSPFVRAADRRFFMLKKVVRNL
jgi:hypothetical protein